MVQNNNLTLVNPTTGKLAFKVCHFEEENPFDQVQRLNYYSIIWIQKGNGILKADFSEYIFNENMMLCFSPYQPFLIEAQTKLSGVIIHFHPDFFCIHKHHKEVACDGVLFNDIYSTPTVEIEDKAATNFEMIITQFKDEMQKSALAQYELLISYLKIFLITASRLKTEQQTTKKNVSSDSEEPFILQNLKNYIEKHYKSKHSASEYADMLAITPKALSRLTKIHFNKTLTELIAERIILEAKRELYLTNKTIKEIAYELGYNDEYYFSRFFKKNVDVSPQFYRETVGFDRASTVG
ncbi:AraC family transcriptional regulator [Paracrocinitomix mangrovi]|uniref:helix-turn-helix domain-containing protein n=1 Tax=Paracrocinitomix mangrovi TaxID=2862509 RepID=UPI001ED9E46E|nr:helix-turn-helix domain-containing protein [Paracrocinitomix mangrovi]UKN01998.1 AraC family transcriptional regulator [Paracrocinitomix mangrovi]